MGEECGSICFMTFLIDNLNVHTFQILTHHFVDTAEVVIVKISKF